MNKKEFLEKVEKKLSVLDEKERKDILDEYKDTISEKVKHGQSEEEAVADFGDIDELVKEVLSAYKIDPDYDVKEESTFNKILNDGEDLIKKGADKLAKTSRDLASDFKKTNKDINLSLVFEIVIKIIIAIFLIGLLRLPFLLVYRVGGDLLDSVFSPFGDLFSFLFGILLFIIYISLCVLVFVSLFKSYFKHEEFDDDENIEDENLEEDVKEEKPLKTKEKSGYSFLGEAIMLILKLWLIIFVMVPAAFIDLGILFGLCLSVVYWIKGINLLGLTLLLIGCLVMCTWFIKLIYNVIFKSGKNNFIVLVGSIVLIIIGGLLFADMVINIDYRDGVPTSVEKTVKDFEYQIDGNTNVYNYTGGDIKKEVAEEMEDGNIKLEVTYYKDVNNVSVRDYESSDDYRNIEITTENDGAGSTKFMYNQFIDNLKNNKIYDYDRYYDIDVVVYGNEATLKMIGESE